MIWGISLDWPNKKNYFISWAWDLLSAFRLWLSEDLSLVPILTGFPGGSVVKNLLANAGYTSLGWEDPLEKEMATHSVFLAGKSHGQRSPVGYSPWGCKRVRHNLETKKTNPLLALSNLLVSRSQTLLLAPSVRFTLVRIWSYWYQDLFPIISVS